MLTLRRSLRLTSLGPSARPSSEALETEPDSDADTDASNSASAGSTDRLRALAKDANEAEKEPSRERAARSSSEKAAELSLTQPWSSSVRSTADTAADPFSRRSILGRARGQTGEGRAARPPARPPSRRRAAGD